jgi:hypothetical protein
VTKRRIIKKQLKRIFPKLRSADVRVTSRATKQYNCIAWAAGTSERWWDPAPGYYWPPHAVRDDTLDAVITLYETIGFVVCTNRDREQGFEKIAIFADQWSYTHVARLLDTGEWSSKLGRLEDVSHRSLENLTEGDYGQVAKIMKRPV